ncbi:MAG: ATP-NAD kinase family protein [Gemmatimonadetes bacterium]|nr:ATP-NAD kinase family protein [Gemmatimonadota bacterium]NNM05899.1 ATP-NAD kinase family protein [Gemmatimonadota bacterium]
MKTLGLIVNPIAGMGGRVGLKGTDGNKTLERALSLGARPESPGRAEEAIRTFLEFPGDLRIIAAPGEMGETVVRACGGDPEVLAMDVTGRTTSSHTADATSRMTDLGIDLLMFAGGDGTARDILRQVQDRVVCLGIPTGVKMHSAVFAVNPSRGGELAAQYVSGAGSGTRVAEVMDIDEEALRDGHVAARLFGYMTIPFRRGHVQGLKAGSPEDERYVQQAIAAGIVEAMEDGVTYVVGPGTTTAEVMRLLELEHSLVGVDLVRNRRSLGTDLAEVELLDLMGAGPSCIIVTPVGGQGYLFGRGNQPISHRVIRRVGKDRIIIAATPNKLGSFRGDPLRVDSGDGDTDRWLAGYYKVLSGFRDESVYRVVAA